MDTSEELFREIGDFLKNHPPKSRPSSETVQGLLTANSEILLELKREQAKKKNKNVENANQYELISKMERNLVRICKVAPNTLCETDQAQNNLNTLSKFIVKKQR